MAEKPIKLFKPVKLLGIQDYMYPPFNFLKQRLLSIYPRFKAVIGTSQYFSILFNSLHFIFGKHKTETIYKIKERKAKHLKTKCI